MIFENKVVIVTGAAGGIGRASALGFAKEGARVVVADVAEDGGRDTVGLIEAAGGGAVFASCDISDETQVAAMVELARETFGGLHCAHNNAGLGHGQAMLADVPRQGWDRTLAVNLTGTWLCMKHEILEMQRGGGGSIVNTASATGLVGWPMVGGYGATKAAIINMTKTAAREYAASGIRINAVAPGPINTAMVARAIAVPPKSKAI